MLDYINTYIKPWLKTNNREDLFPTKFELDLFISLAENCCALIEGNDLHEGIVYGHSWDADYMGVISDVYNFIYVPIIRNLLANQDKLVKALEEQIRYGTKITLTTEQMENALAKIREKNNEQN